MDADGWEQEKWRGAEMLGKWNSVTLQQGWI